MRVIRELRKLEAGCVLYLPSSKLLLIYSEKEFVFFFLVERREEARDLASGMEVAEHVILTYFINNSVQGKVLYLRSFVSKTVVLQVEKLSYVIHSIPFATWNMLRI